MPVMQAMKQRTVVYKSIRKVLLSRLLHFLDSVGLAGEEPTEPGVFDVAELEISTLPLDILSLKNIQTLLLDRNQLSSISSAFFVRFNNLRVLSVSHNLVVSFPSQITLCHYLEELNLSNNQISVLPETLFDTHSLKQLDLSYNKISHFPSLVTRLVHLEFFDLSFNKLCGSVHMADSHIVGKLENLSYFSLEGNQVDVLDLQFLDPSMMRSLKLSLHSVTMKKSMIEFLRSSQNLISLHLDYSSRDLINQLFSYSSKSKDKAAHSTAVCVGFPVSGTLEKLSLSNCSLDEVPAGIWEIRNLITLDLSNNFLTTIPLARIAQQSADFEILLKNNPTILRDEIEPEIQHFPPYLAMKLFHSLSFGSDHKLVM